MTFPIPPPTERFSSTICQATAHAFLKNARLQKKFSKILLKVVDHNHHLHLQCNDCVVLSVSRDKIYVSAGQPGRQRGGVGPWESGRRMRPNCALCRDQKYEIQKHKNTQQQIQQHKIQNTGRRGRGQGDWERYIIAIQGQKPLQCS